MIPDTPGSTFVIVLMCLVCLLFIGFMFTFAVSVHYYIKNSELKYDLKKLTRFAAIAHMDLVEYSKNIDRSLAALSELPASVLKSMDKARQEFIEN